MKAGSLVFHGGGGRMVAFTIATDGSGNPAATQTSGSPISGAVVVARTGAGVYTFTWNQPTFGGATRLAFWDVNVNLGSGDWTSRGAVASNVLTVTLQNAGVATNVVSGSLAVRLVFGPGF